MFLTLKGDQHMTNEKNREPRKDIDQQPRQNSRSRQQFAQTSRSDQEQEGVQNPAGDTRDVSREPVDDVDDKQPDENNP